MTAMRILPGKRCCVDDAPFSRIRVSRKHEPRHVKQPRRAARHVQAAAGGIQLEPTRALSPHEHLECMIHCPRALLRLLLGKLHLEIPGAAHTHSTPSQRVMFPECV